MYVFEEYNCLSFYATIKIKAVSESSEDFLQKYLAFFNFLFRFLLT